MFKMHFKEAKVNIEKMIAKGIKPIKKQTLKRPVSKIAVLPT